MWEPDAPAASDLLRQGDLVLGVPFPQIETLRVELDRVVANVRPSRNAIVIEQCCTIDQRKTVTLAELGSTAPLAADHRYLAALMAERFEVGEPYATYEHRIEPRPDLPTLTPGKHHVAQLLRRLTVTDTAGSLLESLQAQRVARMTPLARAHLRTKLALLFSSVEEEDAVWLEAHGFDANGQPRGG